MLDWFVRCVECGATAEDENVAESLGWRFYPDQLGQLQPHCGSARRSGGSIEGAYSRHALPAPTHGNRGYVG